MYNIAIRAYNAAFKRAGGYDGGYHTPATISDDKISDIYGARTRYKMENGGYIAFSINELKERKGDVVAPPLETGTVSPVLLFGLILNACALSLRNSGSVSDYIVTAVQILAIVAMLTGIYQSRDVFRK